MALSELASIKIAILIGCDILSCHKIRIRWQDHSLDIGDDTLDSTTVDEMESMMGCPIFSLRIANNSTKALFDIGAHLPGSYCRNAANRRKSRLLSL